MSTISPSQVLSELPNTFEEFQGKAFTLLWQGTEDGFGKGPFYEKCEGHSNTLTVIWDTNGNVFGGFTPLTWEIAEDDEGKYVYKDDETRKSFLFTLKNPHNIPPRTFALKDGPLSAAICCSRDNGPSFCDIGVSDDCDENTNSYTSYFGDSYVNDTGVDGTKFFTGSETFQVKEIEVLEITD
jgi:hypothetical protein